MMLCAHKIITYIQAHNNITNKHTMQIFTIISNNQRLIFKMLFSIKDKKNYVI